MVISASDHPTGLRWPAGRRARSTDAYDSAAALPAALPTGRSPADPTTFDRRT